MMPKNLVSNAIGYSPRSDEFPMQVLLLESKYRKVFGIKSCPASLHYLILSVHCFSPKTWGPLFDEPKVEMEVDWIRVNAHPSTSRTAGRVAPGKRSVVVCVDSQQFPIYFTSLLVT